MVNHLANCIPNMRQIKFQRHIFWQLGVLGLLFIFMIYLGYNLFQNLETRGISSGFGFLTEKAGFDISFHLISYQESSTYLRAFWVAILNTLVLAALGVILATLIGFLVGIARLSTNLLVSGLAAIYVETLRNVPLLLQIFFWYFAVLQSLPAPKQSLSLADMVFLNIRGLYIPSMTLESQAMVIGGIMVVVLTLIAMKYFRTPFWKRHSKTFLLTGGAIILVTLGSSRWNIEFPQLMGFNFKGGLQLPPEFVAMVVALASYTAAFIAEIVRAGILSVSKGQHESAFALGLSRWQTLRLIVIPQAMKVIIPPLTSQFLNLTKNSSLASAIAFPDLVLVFAGTVLNQTGQAFEIILLTMFVYLSISLIISLLMNRYNLHTNQRERA